VRLLDVNLLIYASNEQSPYYSEARSWLRDLLSSGETVALPWAVIMAFIRLVTNPRVLDPPLDVTNAIEITRRWREYPSVTVPSPTDRHLDVLHHLLASTSTAGNMISDAHLAAIAIEHGAVLCSADNDFARFPGLNWENPLHRAEGNT